MKKLVRPLGMLLLISMLFALAAGCNNNEDASEAPTTAAVTQAVTATPTEAPPEDDGIVPYTFPLAETQTLTVWKGFSNMFASFIGSVEDMLYYQELQERLNIDLDFIEVSDIVVREQFGIMIASQDYADLFDNNMNLYVGGFEKAVADGVVLPFDDYMAKCMPNYTAVLDSNQDWKLAAITESGYHASTYSFPLEGATPTVALSIRQDYLDGVDMERPVTYDDYYEVLKAFKSTYDATLWMNQFGTLYGNQFSGGFGIATYETGQDTMFMLKSGTEVTYGAMEEGFLDYAAYMNKLYNEKLIYDDFLGTVVAMSPQMDIILSDKIGVFISGVTSYPTYNATGSEGFHIVAANPPVVNKGDKFSFSKTDGIQVGWSMSTQCSDPVLAACMLDYLYSDEGYIFSNYGTEDYTFEYVDGKPQLTDVVLRNPDGMVFFIAQNVFLGDGPKVYDWGRAQRYYDADQKEAGAIWGSDNSSYIPAQISMNEAESEKYAAKFAEVSTYATEGLLKFITGQTPLSEFDAFRDMLVTLGVQDCIDAWQSAVDRYYAKAANMG